MDESQKDFYQKLRIRIKAWMQKKSNRESRWAEFILLAPDLFHLLTRLMIDPDVPDKKKMKVAGAIAYFISPLDFIPEAIVGPVGYLDDIALTAYVLNDIINEVDPQIVLRNWAGEKDLLHLVKTILVNSDKILGSGLFRKLKRKIG